VTLRWRIALILAVVALGVAASASVVAFVSTSSQLRSGIDETLRSRAAAVNTAESQSGGRGGRGRGDGDADGHDGGGCPTAGSFQPASGAQLVSADGTVASCIDGGPTLPFTAADLAQRSGTVELRTVSIDGEEYRLLTTPWFAGGTLQVARSVSESDQLLGRLRWQLIGLVAAAVAIAAALGWAVATRLVRPIVRLRDTTHRIAGTLDLSTPIDVKGPGEVGSLAVSFSTMVAEVHRSQEQQRRLVSDASHEMRTPLTSLRGNVELLGRIEELPATERREVIDDVLEDIEELTSLLAELVELASDLAAAEPDERVALGDLARTVATRLERRSDRSMTVVEHDPVEIIARPRQLERAISNLVDNAVKYSEAGTPIVVRIDQLTVTVADRGRGIPPEDTERIFERFHRAVDVRTKPGSGLGLSIVHEIVRSHGGTVFAQNRPGGGAEVGFTLPADLLVVPGADDRVLPPPTTGVGNLTDTSSRHRRPPRWMAGGR
jgi:two-component system, OmpR family, sensor histidine kinase MprB